MKIKLENIDRRTTMIPKFRAWDKETAEMCNVGALYFSRDYELEAVSVHLPNGYVVNRSLTQVNLMQSTGLKDKNGVEIFEGDIVKVSNHPFQKNDNGIGIEINGNYVIGWSEYSLSWLAGNLILAELKPFIEVIGNIYENPELLEVEG